MARQYYNDLGGASRVRFLGPRFKPSEVGRLLSALEGALERAAEISQDAGQVGRARSSRRAKAELLLTKLEVGGSWEAEMIYATKEAIPLAAGATTFAANLPRVAGVLARAFQRIGEAFGREVEIQSQNPTVLDVLGQRAPEDTKLADYVDRWLRTTLEYTDGAEIELMDGMVRIRVLPKPGFVAGRSGEPRRRGR